MNQSRKDKVDSGYISNNSETTLQVHTRNVKNNMDNPQTGLQTISKKQPVKNKTLEQFIEYAYKQKGRKVDLSSQVPNKITDEELTDDALVKMIDTVKQDELLMVPRQLLLIVSSENSVKLRDFLRKFVRKVLEQSDYFAGININKVLSNLPDAPSFKITMDSVRWIIKEKNNMSLDKKQLLINNIANTLAIWFANERGTSIDEISEMLFESVWSKQIESDKNRDAKLRQLTDINQPISVGLACNIFYQKALEKSKEYDKVSSESFNYKLKLDQTSQQLKNIEDLLNLTESNLRSTIEESNDKLKSIQNQHDIELIHLRDYIEKLRTRVLRLMNNNVELLKNGISALKSQVPKPHVAIERMEIVVREMCNEINTLKKGIIT